MHERRPQIQLPLDGSVVWIEESGAKVPKLRADVCMMGMSEALLEQIIEAVAERVMEKMDARAAKALEKEDEDTHTGPEQLIPEGARVWKPN